MAWKELERSGVYYVGLRLGGKKFTRSLDTEDEAEADSAIACIEENLRLIERGRLAIPKGADLMSFLLSNGKVSAPIVVEAVSLKELCDKYFASLPTGCLEETTIYTMKVHQRSLEDHFGKSKLVESIDLVALQAYIAKRSNDRGLTGPLSPITIRKEVVTLRTVWNRARHSKLVQGEFPAMGLKYPKGTEKSPYMSFRDVLKRTKRADPTLAAFTRRLQGVLRKCLATNWTAEATTASRVGTPTH